jgi:hypothetical protein
MEAIVSRARNAMFGNIAAVLVSLRRMPRRKISTSFAVTASARRKKLRSPKSPL